MNSVAKAASLGVSCVLLGVLLLIPGWRTAVVVLAAVGLQLFTAPIGGYALARAAYRSGAPLAPVTRYDELGGGPARVATSSPATRSEGWSTAATRHARYTAGHGRSLPASYRAC